MKALPNRSVAPTKCEPDRRCDPRRPSGYSADDLISMCFIPTPKLAALVKNTKEVSDQGRAVGRDLCGWWAGADYTVSEPALEIRSGTGKAR
jgi:hypothetical protein